ncbi:MAG: cytochrome c maturation protein CcmE [Methanosarcinales archaeon]|nr:cytochrome c maturation protein CcmE [ANME-2 cluster archaeon]MDF1532376.1 cytochrome c maturation protein CcmE [ANME-2 cluster archaeon]MDW7775949.1 cytochrome c maturation protein CcmE [Methanosarcinales archaeon]
MRKKDKIILSVIAIVLVAIVGMWGLDFQSEYLTVSQVKLNASEYIGQDVEVTGNVKQDTLKIDTEETYFVLTDDVYDIEVFYRGERPQALANGAQVSVRGTLVSADRVDANFLVMGCPSKYGTK